jgi:hypothetical protein
MRTGAITLFCETAVLVCPRHLLRTQVKDEATATLAWQKKVLSGRNYTYKESRVTRVPTLNQRNKACLSTQTVLALKFVGSI